MATRPRWCRSAARAAGLATGLAASLALLLAGSTSSAAPPLEVAVKSAPPFAVRDSDGRWSGTSIELWREIAAELELDYELRETSLDDMLSGVADGRYQVAVAALTVTAEREARVDFTHPFYTTGLAIAATRERRPYWRGVVDTVFSWAFLRLIGALAAIQLSVGAVVWLVERRRNPEQFPAAPGRGVPSGFWWATVTMTTVGYGDKAPKTALGRAVALAWMLASMIILASVTATIASSLTVERLDGRIRGPEDLHRFDVGVVASTSAETYMREHSIVSTSYADAPRAMKALREGEIDAFVWDAPLLRALMRRQGDGSVELVPGLFQRQDYAIAVGEGSDLREAINRVLPEKIRQRSLDGL